MSAIVVLTPVLTAAWPTISAAALGAASTLGFAAGSKRKQATRARSECVDVDVPGSREIAGGLSAGEEMSFSKGDLMVVFSRDARGRCGVRVQGEGRAPAELERVGREFAESVVQQYAYHRLVEELGTQGFEVIGQEVGEDRTIHVQVRRYVG